MRLAMHKSRAHIERAVRDAGFHDLHEHNFPAFSYPLPDGTRPSVFARQRGISRQAANHLLREMEALGYFERRETEDSKRRLIFLTSRGEQVAETIYAALRQLHQEWGAKVGRERFAVFMEVLRELTAEENMEPDETPSLEDGG
jgi:DNA-binding MarR family transcriptional regulator